MPTTAREPPTPLLQTKMARFEPLKIDQDDYEIHVVSDPYTLPYKQQNEIIREIREVTQKYRPDAGRKEIRFRTVDPHISLLLLVREKKTGKAVGYFSTRTPIADTIHLHASVFDPKHRDLAFYGVCKLLAQALERKKMQMHGQTPHYVTAQSQEPDVLVKLAAHDGMLPAPLHGEGAKALNAQAARVSKALDADVAYDGSTGIRIGGLKAMGDEKSRPKPLKPEAIEMALRRVEGTKKKALRDVLNAIDRPRGDAALAILRIDREHEEKINAAESLIPTHLHPLMQAELALGIHRQHVDEIKIHPDIRIHPTGQKLKLMEINVDANKVNWAGLQADLQHEKEERTPLGMALQGHAADQTWERTAQNHAAIVPASPKMLIPLGPMVTPFLRILSRNFTKRPRARTP
ncbi:hypothetical protein HYV43_02635 [Candidatus Micrarchaeota archaeon]|nr:hypothetical protein [Candidatus Micrarchaeota archaeon]